MVKTPVGEGVLGRGLPYLRTGSGAPLVMLAGLTPDHRVPSGINRRFTVQQMAPYARRREVWWTNRRQGLSQGVRMANLAEDYAEALRATFDEPADVVGTSTGGSVALQLAADHPDVVRRLVVVASAYRLGERGRQAQRRLAELMLQGRSSAAGSVMLSMLGATGRSRRVLAGLGRVVGPLMLRTEDLGDFLATIEAEDVSDLRDRLDEVRCPVLVVGGDRDAFYDDGRLISETAELLPHARLVLYRGKGHAGVITDKQLPAGVLNFLEA